jgi:predicted AAA+ superfamily ATPase
VDEIVIVTGTNVGYIVTPAMTVSHDLLRLKLAESLATEPPALTRRDVRLPGIPGKAFAVIGVRRGGKTSFLAQCRADRLAEGRTREAQLLISLEDERLAGLSVAELGWLLDEHARRFPGLREAGGMTLYLDEIQTVPGWEGLVRRLMDAGGIEIFVSGSSAKLLSREVATSLRGRAMEVLVHPFSFREALRHAGAEPPGPFDRLGPVDRAELDQRLRRYLAEGGFPEAQGASPRDRAALLGGYVDVVVLRDVIERHGVSNPLALRWIERQLLANPGGPFSVKKHYDTLRSQGVAVGKDTLHDYLAYLEDAFLARTVAMHSASERQRMVNPRKAYPVDPGLIALFERSGRAHHGMALETVVMLELERRDWEVAYVRTAEGFEVDFLAHRSGDAPLLLQVCLESEGDETWDRELRALEAAAAGHPDARPFLVTLDGAPPSRPLPPGLTWAPAARWLLEEM